jgi:hypothetical protein
VLLVVGCEGGELLGNFVHDQASLVHFQECITK